MMLCIFFGLIGLLLGSFLNVCILRLPLGQSVARPRSHCPQCNRPIAARDNIPIVSWLLLGAACRGCGGRISWRYPAIEMVTCGLFVGCCQHFSFSWIAACWSILCFLLFGLAVMDAETLLLPDAFTLPGLAAGIVFAALRPGLASGDWAWKSAVVAAERSLLAALVAAATLLLIAGAYWLARRRMGMGLGDVKLLAMLASWLGMPQTALVLFLGVIVGALYGLATMMAPSNKKRPSFPGQLPIPFGTMLSLAGIYSIFLGQRTLQWYLHFFR